MTGNFHIYGQKRIAFSHSDPGTTKVFFSRNEEVYVSEEVKENALDSHQRENHADQKYTAENQYACHDLSV